MLGLMIVTRGAPDETMVQVVCARKSVAATQPPAMEVTHSGKGVTDVTPYQTAFYLTIVSGWFTASGYKWIYVE